MNMTASEAKSQLIVPELQQFVSNILLDESETIAACICEEPEGLLLAGMSEHSAAAAHMV